MSTVSKDDNLVLSSEDSSCPDESELELGLGLSLSHRPVVKSQPASHARILTAKDFPSRVSSSASPSGSSASSSMSRANVTAGTKRTADSVVATNGLSQIVGWPPLGAYRMNSFNSHAKLPATEVFNSMVQNNNSNNKVLRKNNENENENDKINVTAKEKGHQRSSLFVKVNMEGVAIGRKIDLSAHSSYETLAQALEDMFNENSTVATCKIGVERQSKLLEGSSKFVLTYEDKEGDWMLVGDVPWGMFVSSVRRLRIMRTSEANGLEPRLEEQKSRQRSKPI